MYYGISPQALNWVQSFLTNRTQQVLLEGNMSLKEVLSALSSS